MNVLVVTNSTAGGIVGLLQRSILLCVVLFTLFGCSRRTYERKTEKRKYKTTRLRESPWLEGWSKCYIRLIFDELFVISTTWFENILSYLF